MLLHPLSNIISDQISISEVGIGAPPPILVQKVQLLMASPWAIYVYIHKHYRQTWLQRLRLLREGGVLFTNSNMMVRSVPSGEVPTETPANI